jgi:transcriptional regulator with XRE-family HTH domain
MARTLDQELRKLPQKRRSRIEARAAELIAEELSLQEIRRALKRTQAELAKRLGVRQDTVSRYETGEDLMVSTLARYVRAMGGTLSLIAEFPNGTPVRIRALGVAPTRKGRRRRQGPRSAR